MNAYKCDRCGNYFEKKKLLRNGEYFVRKTDIVEGKTEVDLCESCNSKFQIWMNKFNGDLVDKTIEAVLGGTNNE